MQNKISEVRIIPIKHKDGLVSFASFVFDNCFYVGSIGIYTRPQGGYRLTYPTRKVQSASLPVFHPINKEVTALIEQGVIAKFEAVYGGW